jgi:RimJ/RimL family protein N-acetyltransferase
MGPTGTCPQGTTVNSEAFRPPVRLSGQYLDLLPLQKEQLVGLSAAGRSAELWTYMRSGPADTSETMAGLIDLLLRRQSEGTDLAFTVVRKSDAVIVGMTRFLEIEPAEDAVEVGGSWLDRSLWGSPFNTDAKRQMLGYAFDVGNVHRVQIKTDLRNVRSQRAIERLGATREGVLREHVVVSGGHRRSSVVYSILRDEWPAVRDGLDEMLRRPWPKAGSSAGEPR